MGPQYNFKIEIENISIGIILFLDPTKHFFGSQHQHSAYELHFFSDGEANISINGTNCTMRSNRGYLVSRNTFHKTNTISDSMCRASFLFTLKKVNDNETSAYDQYIELFKTLPPFLEFDVHENLQTMFNLLFSYLLSASGKAVNDYYIKSISTLIFIELFKCLFNENAENGGVEEKPQLIPFLSDETRQDIICAYFSDNLATATLDELSKILHLSKRQVSRFLSEKMNDTFSGLIKKHRIEHAKLLITSGVHTLEEIAYLCGYNTYKGFYLAFSKYTGTNPQKFKESIDKDE